MDNLSFELLKNGDAKVYKALFDELYEPLCQYALIYVNEESIAEEIVHELFIWLWEKRDRLTIHTSLKSYLFSSVRNRCFNFKRDHKSMTSLDDSFDELEGEVLQEISEYEQLDMDQLQNMVKEAIAELPPKCREIFLLSRESGLSYAEIAEELSVSRKTVENQMGIALKRLKERLSPALFLFVWYL
ncbi:MAG: RNA polymerase sigma-70 factor [Marinifilaceae bacterium]